MKRQSLLLLIILHALTTVRASVLVGKTEGAMTVGATGAANYTIPIKLLPGLSDFVPQLSLTYNSQAGNGLAGFGWNISGMSAITISPRNVYFDGEAECIYRGEDNAYYLDGMRLLPVSGTNGQQGAVYRTENEHFSHIEITSWNGSTPTTFTVKTTDGTVYKYGNGTGRLLLSGNEAYQWMLDYAEDRLGNYIIYTYAQEGLLYPTSVSYGRNTHGDKGVSCMVSFVYENRTDSIPVYLLATRVACSRRLKRITCQYDGNTYRTYALTYNDSVYSHLTSVTESGTSSASYSPTTDMNGVTKQYTYDTHGYPLCTIHGNSYVETRYDKYGILRSRTRHDGADSTRTDYTYDQYDRLTKEEGPLHTYQYSYDQYNRLTSENRALRDSISTYYLYTGYTYNTNNQLAGKTSLFSTAPYDYLAAGYSTDFFIQIQAKL